MNVRSWSIPKFRPGGALSAVHLLVQTRLRFLLQGGGSNLDGDLREEGPTQEIYDDKGHWESEEPQVLGEQ